tara:strand:- start:1512 stop:2018 length:507 start_codon:yes stop_codon:yes gene_type:complete
MDLKDIIRDYPDYPKKGIIFKDMWPTIEDPDAFEHILKEFENEFRGKIDRVIGIESRGFIFGAALANRLKIGFTPIRKKGKLPGETISTDFELEYGSASIEMKNESLKGKNILIIDDLLATGGTVEAAIKLVEELDGNIISLGFLIELDFLKAREILSKYDIFSIVRY